MLKASALYVSIIIALVIAIFSASLISTAYFYRFEVQKKLRYTRLYTNLNSGMALLLSESYPNGDFVLDLYGEEADSLILQREEWGIFDVGTIKAFALKDTLKKTFLIAKYGTKDKTAIYLSDEDRPLSVSGNTEIRGDALLPKAGIKQAYVESRPYSGSKLVYGQIGASKRELPPLNKERLKYIERFLNDSTSLVSGLPDSLINSFFNPSQVIRLHKFSSVINNVLAGRIVVLSDTVVNISASASLKDVLVFAPAIVVADGFKGTCQLFARDSIVTGKQTVFTYPSSMGIIKTSTSKHQAKIVLGSNSIFSGILFSHEEKRSDLQTMISLGKNSKITGEVYVTGFIKIEKPVTIEGKVLCNRFIIQTPTTLYENYLIDITINRDRRSKHYLSSSLFDSEQRTKGILKWLN